MESVKRPAESDISYGVITENSHKRIRLQEEINFKNDCERIMVVLKNEFKNETCKRQQELHIIQKRLLKAQKTLHLLKYIIIKSFYNRQELKILNKEESVLQFSAGGSEVRNLPMTSQERIHPAIKKIIGKRPLTYEPHRTRTQSQFVSKLKEEPTAEISEENSPQNSKPLIGDISYCNDVDSAHRIRNRQKVKYQIVVGNISKWIPMENSRDSSTHKWMVYVRGPRDNPDISHIVKKIRFFLHPSYQPNDIVELEEQPFHLSRRGWGEFPLRVQIHFQCSQNKPVDVIHNLKLDRTYTGRQTLGNETQINVWLYDNNKDEYNSSQDSEYVADNYKNMEGETNDELHNCNHTSEYVNRTVEQLVPKYEFIQSTVTHSNANSEDCGLLQNRKRFLSENNVNTCMNIKKNVRNSSVKENSGNLALADNFQSKSHNLLCASPVGDNNTIIDRIQHACSDTNSNHSETHIKNTECDRNITREVVCASIRVENKMRASNTSCQAVDTNTISKPNQNTKKICKNDNLANNLLKIKNSNFNLVLKTNEIVRDVKLVYLIDHCYTKIDKIDFSNNFYNTTSDSDKYVEQHMDVIDTEKYKIHLPVEKFSSSRQIVYFLFKSLPLVTKLAFDPSYRCHYSYAASSLNEFSSWNRTKRFCSEWFRAKHIKNILLNHKISNEENWTVKIILMFGRANAFTPLAKYDLFKKTIESGKTVPNRMMDTGISSTFTEHTSVSNLVNTLHVPCQVEEDNCVIDVEYIDNEIKGINDDIETTMEIKEYMSPCTYIRECAKQLEIHLKPEEILPDIWKSRLYQSCIIETMDTNDLYYSEGSHLIDNGNSNWMENTVLVGNENISWQEDGPEITVDYSEIAIDQSLVENEGYITADTGDSDETSQYFSILESNCDNSGIINNNSNFSTPNESTDCIVNVEIVKEETIIPDITKSELIDDDEFNTNKNTDNQLVLYRMDGSDDLYAVQIADDGKGNLQKYQYKVTQSANGEFEPIPGSFEIQNTEIDEHSTNEDTISHQPDFASHFIKEEPNSLDNSENILADETSENHLESSELHNSYFISNEKGFENINPEYVLQNSYDENEHYENVSIMHELNENGSSKQSKNIVTRFVNNTNIFPPGNDSESEYEIEALDEDFQDENVLDENSCEEHTSNSDTSQILQHKSDTVNLQISNRERENDLKQHLSNNRNVTIFKDDKHLSVLVVKSKEKENVLFSRQSTNFNPLNLRSILKSNCTVSKVNQKEKTVSTNLQSPLSITTNDQKSENICGNLMQINTTAIKSIRQPRKQTITPIDRVGSEIIVQPLVYSLDVYTSCDPRSTSTTVKRKRVTDEILQISDESDPEFTLKSFKKKKSKRGKYPRKNSKQKKLIEITIIESDDEMSSDDSVIEVLTDNESSSKDKMKKISAEGILDNCTSETEPIAISDNECTNEKIAIETPPATLTRLKTNGNVVKRNSSGTTQITLKKQITSNEKSLKQIFSSPKCLRSSTKTHNEALKSRKCVDIINNTSAVKEKLKCEYCGQTFSERTLFTFHRNSHKTFPCPNCKTTFTAKLLLDDHLRKNCLKSPVKKRLTRKSLMKCDICHLAFTTTKQMKNHISFVHKTKKNIVKPETNKPNNQMMVKKRGAHGGVPMSIKMQKAFDKIKLKT
ncbi:D12 [Carabus blaptoides fortunei]